MSPVFASSVGVAQCLGAGREVVMREVNCIKAECRFNFECFFFVFCFSVDA